MWIGVILALLVVGLALHGPVGTPRSAVDTSGGRNPTHDRLAASDLDARSEFLAALLSQGGAQACPRVTLPIFQGFSPTASAVWTVACVGGHTYQLVIPADSPGSVTVVDCAGLPPEGVPCLPPLN